MSALSEAGNKLRRELRRGLQEGDGCLPEADTAINNASRSVITAMVEDHGEAWLGKINLHGDERHGAVPVLWKWDDEPVCNFGCAFVTPRHDADLERLIRERDDATYTTTAADAVLVEAIINRVYAIGGIYLSWT